MAIDKRFENLLASYEKTAYFKWMKSEGLPVVQGHGVEDVRELPLAPWPRVGGKGCFVQLHGMEGVSSMYIAEIPPGGALNVEKHLYEEVICILAGQGATEVWQDGGPKRMFEWGPFSLFAPPINTWHRLINGGREPVRFLAMTNAPVIMDVFHNSEFIFNNSYQFSDRYKGEEDYFAVKNNRYERGMQPIWETNFIPDIKSARLDSMTVKGAGVEITQFEVSGNGLIGHISGWPEGRYHKAHYHGAGAVLLGLESSGYVLLWSKELGTRPFQDGRGDEVVKIEWKEGSVYCPPNGWYHQHFNTGAGKARQLAVRYGSRLNSVGFMVAGKRQDDGVYLTAKEGGTLIDYEDEDPEIRRMYAEKLGKAGIKMEMPLLKR